VRTSLNAVKILPELSESVAEVAPHPNVRGLERVAAQHFDEEEVEVLARVALLPALDVAGPVDVAFVVAVARLLRR
jgi:hypothetical protein